MTNRRDRDGQDFVNRAMYMLTAPYLAFPGWEAIYEANANKERARAARMVHHLEIFETQQATEFEAMLYISSATLAQPVSHDWANIYMHLFKRWDPEAAQRLQMSPTARS